MPLNSSWALHRSPVLTSSITFRCLIEWFACARLSESHLPRSYVVTFPKRSLPWLFTNAALGGLEPAPASRLRVPPRRDHLLCSYAHFMLKVRSWRTWRYHKIFNCLVGMPCVSSLVGTRTDARAINFQIQIIELWGKKRIHPVCLYAIVWLGTISSFM